MPLLVILALGWGAGLMAASRIEWPWWAWLAGAGGAFFLYVIARRRGEVRLALPMAFTLAFGLGGLRFEASQPNLGDPSKVAYYNDSGRVSLVGVVWDEPDVREARTQLRVRVSSLAPAESSVPTSVDGLALIYAPRYSEERLAATGEAEWRYGDRVAIAGLLETPPEFEDFSYRDYLARVGIHSQVRAAAVTFVEAGQGSGLWQALFDFKGRALDVLAQTFPEPHAALLQGILLGVESGIPTQVKADFSATGTSHIVAISGFNIAILVGVFTGMAGRLLGRTRGAVVAGVAIAAYTLLVGASASVVRAAIMGGLSVLAERIGRRSAGLNTLAFSGVVMTIINPLTLWDVGFQLSVAATLGLILYGDPLQRAFREFAGRWLPPGRADRLTGLAGDMLLLTLAAQLTTLPLLAYYFRQISIVSLLANAVILPAQPLVMILGGLALLLGLIWLPLGQLAAWLVWPLTAYTLSFVGLFARVPGAVISLAEVAPAALAVSYAALFGLTWLLGRPADQRPAWWGRLLRETAPAGGLVFLSLVVVIVWSGYFSRPDGRLRVTALEVGRGDAVLIQLPSGAQVLINGGPSGGALMRALARHLPRFDTTIELLVIASVDEASLGGLPDLLERYTVEQAIVTQAPGRGATYRAVMEALSQAAIPREPADDNDEYQLGSGVNLRVLADGEPGTTLLLVFDSFSALLPARLGPADEAGLVASGDVGQATALLAAGPGHEYSMGELWLETVAPHAVVISMGGGDSLAPGLIERLAGRTVLRTDERGPITLVTDGRRLWVEAGR